MGAADAIADLRVALGRRLADCRKAVGYSQEALAPLTGYARSTVANVEVGRQSVPRDFWERCDEVLGTGPELAAQYDELEQRVTAERAQAARAAQARRQDRIGQRKARDSKADDEARDEIGRRAVLAHGVTALGLPALTLDDLRHVAAALDDAHRYMDRTIVEHFTRQLETCAGQDGDNGPKSALPTVLGLIGAIESGVRKVKPAVRDELLAVGARCAEFAGWLYRDSGAIELGDYWRDRAMEWAQAGGDREMQGYVLLKKSQAAWDQRDAVRMLMLARAAEDRAWRLPARVRAEAAQQRARGHAMLGDSVDLVHRQLDKAHALLIGEAESTSTQVSPHYRSALLQIQTAMCYQVAGRPQEAASIYREHLTSASFSRRDYGYFASLGASASALANEPDDAARLAMTAHRIATATHSVRTANEVVRVVRQLDRWAARPAVRELRAVVLDY
ncbi:helix-turn-helix domain-containing protein [Kribbella antibiotica]|uniref:helix-turn-helix domain-containing protein n=1 Tax=Kribbella antibiotica TaxID=190195 RepID=UPI001404AD8A|nr:helix-turn-helix transcriptional regulator [Kribbella antibiotica]